MKFWLYGDSAIAELMVYPYRTRDEIEIARGIAFFMRENFLQVLSHDSAVFDTAARLRAETGKRSTDALEVFLIKDC